MTTARPVTVIGAGLTGLSTAWYLTQRGARVEILEAGQTTGGLIQTGQRPEGLVETAARAFTKSERVMQLFADAGVAAIEPRAESRKRYIFRNGRARRWPLSFSESIATGVTAGAAWIRRDMRPRGEESVTEWGSRVLGSSATTWLLAPALQGIYASPPDQLAAAAIFGPGRRPRGSIVAPAGGMGELLGRMRDRLIERGAAIHTGTSIREIDPSVPTALCTDGSAAAVLLAPHAPELARAIANIRMVSLRAVTAFYDTQADDVRGFGVLFPRSAGIAALGVLFNADMFDGRSDLRSETWIYGDVRAEALPKNDADAREHLRADRRVFTSRESEPRAIYLNPAISRLPIYDRAVLAVRSMRDSLPASIAIAGNYLGRLGVTALLDEADAAAARLMS